MEKILFKPLRRRKSDNKVVVGSYASWGKVGRVARYKCEIVIDTDYRSMDPEEYVHNHKGELLYFYRYDPNEMPTFKWRKGMEWEEMNGYQARALEWCKGNVTYNGKGIDCDGIPCFSHYTADYIGTHNFDLDDFYPLTVKQVIMWYGWFIMRLENATIKVLS